MNARAGDVVAVLTEPSSGDIRCVSWRVEAGPQTVRNETRYPTDYREARVWASEFPGCPRVHELTAVTAFPVAETPRAALHCRPRVCCRFTSPPSEPRPLLLTPRPAPRLLAMPLIVAPRNRPPPRPLSRVLSGLVTFSV